MNKIAVIGDGGWGTALALVLCSGGRPVSLWSHSKPYAELMRAGRENVKFLEGVELPECIEITSSVEEVASCRTAFFAVPCRYMRSVAEAFSGFEFDTLISATKGIEHGSLKRPSEVLTELFPRTRIGVISGPSIAYEVARKYPTTAVLAMKEAPQDVRDMLMTEFFRVYTSRDIIGVETAGALKNVIAIAAGISDGLGYGANAKAGILTRGLVEITRLGIALGAERSTFRGLSGLGDLATTCISPHSRNRWFGQQLTTGRSIDEILQGTDMVVEGYFTAESAYALSCREGVSMPIAENIYQILYEGKPPENAVKDLMGREPKEEDIC